MLRRRKDLAQRLLGAVDLAIDFATLGEYGLEPAPVDGPCRERPGHPTGWEALATVRPRGACAPHDQLRVPDLTYCSASPRSIPRSISRPTSSALHSASGSTLSTVSVGLW